MSAHRDPETVAEYAKNARLRGMRVIIAGAGLSAALPGVVAAHTELPVIGVPLSSKTSVAGGLDALLAVTQMPPGVPVASVGVDNAKNAAVLAARILERVIERYTRPEMGVVWTERRKLDTWLQVELAVVDALAEQGVVPQGDADVIRDRASFTVEAVKEREQVTDHDVAAFVDVVAESVGEAGRWVHHGLTSSDVLDTALALQLSQAGLILCGGAARLPGRARQAGARARRHDLRRAARTGSRPSRPRSGSSSPGSRSRRTATCTGSSGPWRESRSGRCRARWAPTRRTAPRSRPRCCPGWGSAVRTSRRRWCRATGTPSCSRRSRSRAPGSSASRPRSATSSAPRCERWRSRSGPAPRRARRPCRTSATRSCPSASRGSRACCAATRRPGSRTWRCGTSATSRTRRPSEWRCPTRRSCSTTRSTWRCGWSRAWSCTRTACSPTSRPPTARSTPSARCSPWSRRGRSRDEAYRIVQENAQRAWDTGTHFRELLATAAPDLDLDAVFDAGAFVRHAGRDRGAARPDRLAQPPVRRTCLRWRARHVMHDT